MSDYKKVKMCAVFEHKNEIDQKRICNDCLKTAAGIEIVKNPDWDFIPSVTVNLCDICFEKDGTSILTAMPINNPLSNLIDKTIEALEKPRLVKSPQLDYIAFDAEPHVKRPDEPNFEVMEGVVSVKSISRCVLCGEQKRSFLVEVDCPERGLDKFSFCQDCLNLLKTRP